MTAVQGGVVIKNRLVPPPLFIIGRPVEAHQRELMVVQQLVEVHKPNSFCGKRERSVSQSPTLTKAIVSDCTNMGARRQNTIARRLVASATGRIAHIQRQSKSG